MPPYATCDAIDRDHWSVFLSNLNREVPSFHSSFIPFSQRASLFAEFSEILNECRVADWNGYHSDPVGVKAEQAALKFLHNLPADVPDPSVDAIPEGLMAFEWYKGPKELVTVVPNINNGIDYAIRRGDEVLHGSAPFFGTIPATILYHVRDLTR